MDSCPICGEVDSLRKCSGCESVSYCSSNHQKEHWQIHKDDCCPYTITRDSVFGRQMIAKKDLKPGSLVLAESPKLYCPIWKGTNWVCLVCGLSFNSGQKSSLRLCSTCKWPICSENCEKNPMHAENECKIFASQKIVFPPKTKMIKNSSRKLIPNLDLDKQDTICKFLQLLRGVCLKKNNLQVYKKLMKEDYSSLGLNNLKVIIIILKTLVTLDQLKVEVDDDELLKFLVVNATNNFIWNDDDQNKERAPIHGTYTKSTRMSHSCSPNCSRIIIPYPSLIFKVRTTVEVKKGQSLTINYMEDGFELLCRLERQQRLEHSWKFSCKCARCIDPFELETFMDGVACLQCQQDDSTKVNGYFYPDDPLNIDIDNDTAIWSCRSCKNKKSYTQIFDILEIQQVELETIKMGLEEGGNLYSNVKPLENYIKDKSGKILHPNHRIIQFVAKEIIELLEENLINLTRSEYDTLIKLNLFLLDIANQIGPGISLLRASTLIKLCSALLAASRKTGIFTTMERINMLKLAISSNDEAAIYFNFDSTLIPENKSKIDLLACMKGQADDLLKTLVSL